MRMEKKKQTPGIRLSLAWKAQLRRLPLLLLFPLAIVLPALLSRFPDTVEKLYSQGVYPVLSSILSAVFGLAPFSVAEWILYTLAVGVPAVILITFVRTILKRTQWVRFTQLILTVIIAFGIAFNAFYLMWGFNYSRPTLGKLLSLDVRERPVEELETLCYSLAEQAAILRENVREDERGIFSLTDTQACFEKIPAAYETLGNALPLFRMRAARPKPVLAAEGLSWAGISGIYTPFTAEPNVNIHQSALLIPSSAAHESAHSLGIAREDEANFVAYLSCMASDDPTLQYSGVMLALIHCGNQLNKVRPEAYTKMYLSTYSQGMLRDLKDYNAYWDAYEGPVEETMNRMNDGYLKYNRQESGVKSYGQMVDLLLAWHAQTS